MTDNDIPEWNINQMEPDKSPMEIAENLADHFVGITNQNAGLHENDMPLSEVTPVLIPQLLEQTVETKLKDYNKPKSTVPGDLPPSIVNENASSLCVPLTLIYNKCLINTDWPKIWKTETIIPIPKK